MTACGLDFGTSNTTIGVVRDGVPALLPVDGDAVTIPSAIFYDEQGGGTAIGRAAIAAYVGGSHGRLMRSLKSVLGNALIDETTLVGRQRVKFRTVIAHYVAAVKRRAEAAAGVELTDVVHGRPVHFVDGDPDGDARAEATLAEIARSVGFTEISFQFEPIAAALDYERTIDGEHLALIADIGGGTSDFSIVRLGPDRHRRPDRSADILANDGVRIGGTDFDRQLSLGTIMPLLGFGSAMKAKGLAVPSSYYFNLATWSSINRLYEPKARREVFEVVRDCARPELVGRLLRAVEDERGHALAMAVESAKITVADHGAARVALDELERGLAAAIDHDALVRHTDALAVRIGERVANCLATAGLTASAIDAVFLTGGSTRLSHVRDAIVAGVPSARVVEGDTFGSVGTGLTVEAGLRYGPA